STSSATASLCGDRYGAVSNCFDRSCDPPVETTAVLARYVWTFPISVRSAGVVAFPMCCSDPRPPVTYQPPHRLPRGVASVVAPESAATGYPWRSAITDRMMNPGTPPVDADES